MINLFMKKLFYKFVPFPIRMEIEQFILRYETKSSKRYIERQEAYFKYHIDEFRFNDERKADILRIFSFLKKNGATTFPDMADSIRKKYFTRKLEIKKDLTSGLFYVLIDNNKKLFYKRDNNEKSVYRAFNSVSLEQDYASPHRYLTNDQYFVGVTTPETNQVGRREDSFGVTNGGIVIDAGAAEGNFALSVIEKASKIYIIESDAGWCEALKHTFSPYREKIIIIQKHLSDVSDKDNITLNDLIEKYQINKIDLLKMDIEGFEKQALQGGTTKNKAFFADINKLAICTYHNPEDEFEISKFATQYGYKSHLTQGYIFFPDANPTPIRKAVLRAYRENKGH
ncbi:FkbM family methyltransferase [Candidatus Bathycorpusculum sp.]|uniref:FkbM family methyltransferase n=1 Tax=Candidatus Bathycorpusculum sp. TaxID=2994959 RepID=UPI002824131B|nr:FkbM family methyltransferase [Candidatus Termitimicrobium sp.]MCL2430977.1 FkbM family methyltransferase [Candidatus Termitimicrobium sp.]